MLKDHAPNQSEGSPGPADPPPLKSKTTLPPFLAPGRPACSTPAEKLETPFPPSPVRVCAVATRSADVRAGHELKNSAHAAGAHLRAGHELKNSAPGSPQISARLRWCVSASYTGRKAGEGLPHRWARRVSEFVSGPDAAAVRWKRGKTDQARSLATFTDPFLLCFP